jgi:hypothetical protein
MELCLYLYFLIRHLDRLSQCRLAQVVPDIDHLLADPADHLKYQEVIFRAYRPWASLIALSSVVLIGEIAIFHWFWRPAAPLEHQIFFVVLFIALPGGAVMLAMLVFRGNSCILSAEEVRFVKGSTEIHCPWELFGAPGQPNVVHFLHGNPRLELPVVPGVVPFVEAKKHEKIIGRGFAFQPTGQFYFRFPNELIIESVYQVKPMALGQLLLQVGRILGAPANGLPLPQSAAMDSEDGWIAVRLTGVAFPNACCECGIPTTDAKGIGFGGVEGGTSSVSVPHCAECQRQHRWRFWKAYGKVLLIVQAIAASVGFVVGTAIANVDRNGQLFPALAIILAIAGCLLALLSSPFFIKWAARRASPSLRCKGYVPDQGTVALWFRRPGYANEVLRATCYGPAAGNK